MNNRILAIIISYKPNIDRLKANIDAFINYVDKILIWENMSNEEASSFRHINHSKIQYYCANANKGIAFALNYAVKHAKTEGFDYILTMDQDSIFEGFCDFKQACINKYREEICLIGPLVNSQINNNPTFQTPKEVNIITSGMLIPTHVIDALGGYYDYFFVDGIDIELCMRAMSRGIKIYQFTGANLDQRFGEHKYAKLFNKKFLLRSYSAHRLHEIIKNNIIIYRNYKEAKYLKRVLRYYFFIHPILVLIYEDDKINKIQCIYKGFYRGLKHKY